LKLEYDELVSNSTLYFNLRRYVVVGLGIIYQTALTAGETSMARFNYPLPSLGRPVQANPRLTPV